MQILELFQSRKIRFGTIAFVVLLQVMSLMLKRSQGESLFYVSYMLFAVLGFLSIGWKQALANLLIAVAAVPALALIAMTVATAVTAATIPQTLLLGGTVYGIVVVSVLPFFAAGFGLRALVLRLARRRA